MPSLQFFTRSPLLLTSYLAYPHNLFPYRIVDTFVHLGSITQFEQEFQMDKERG